MAQNDETGEKTEEATPRQRERAREEGRVASSREVGTLFVLTAATLSIYFGSSFMVGRMEALFIKTFQEMADADLSLGDAIRILEDHLFQTLIVIAPVMGALVVASLAGWVSQVGFLLASKPLQPKLSRINPIEGAKRIFSSQILAETAKSIFKFAVVGIVSYHLFNPIIPFAASTVTRDPKAILATMFELGLDLALYLLLFLLAVAVFDYSYQKWRHSKDLRMSRYEVKKELKEQEGDPQIKARVRSIRQQQIRQQMIAEVPKAEVIITNPTHYAIAIRYDMDERPAPHVLAKGRGVIAQRIKEIATENGIPLYEDKWLARQLYAACNVGDGVPVDLWQAVAKVLAYVRSLDEKLKKVGA